MMWRTPIGHRTLWLLDQRLRPRGRRRLLLAVDTSDSCWPARRPDIESAIRSIASGLQCGDECRAWIMGRSTPAAESSVESDTESARAALAHRLCDSLAAEQGGTWLRETAHAMIADSRSASDTIDYFLVISDGDAIFDAEAVPPPPSGCTAAIYTLPRRTHTPTRPGGAGGLVHGWPAAPGDLARWLALEPAQMQLETTADLGATYRFAATGEVDPIAVSWPQRVDGHARHAWVSATAPALRVVARRGDHRWQDALTVEMRGVNGIAELPRELHGVAMRVWGLQIDWRMDVLALLACGSAASIACPNCAAAYAARDVREGRPVFCDLCHALLLVHGWARRDDPALTHAGAVWWDAEAGAKLASHPRPEILEGLSIPLERASF
jgi:hypothetical protein